ncbi:MAG: bactofilin family protein [Candidatus Binatia bacterium]
MAWFGRHPRSGSVADRPSPSLGTFGLSDGAPAEFSPEGLVAHLYKGSRVTGQMTFHGTTRIDGSVDGEILCHGKLTIGEGAEIRAKVSGEVVVIRGQVEGNITAREKVELGAPARLLGNIDAPRLVVEEGVVIDGRCAMGGAGKKREVPLPLSSSSEPFEGGSPKLATTLEK